MRDYVQARKCKREIILGYFRFQVPSRNDALHNCCDYHRHICSCEDCIIASVSNMFQESGQEDQTGAIANTMSQQLEPHSAERLREELNLFHLSLPGSGRSAVGSAGLSSGITTSLINEIVKNVNFLTSVEEIATHLPIYSKSQAVVIWNVHHQKILNSVICSIDCFFV